MDFVVGLPLTSRKNDAILVIVDQLTRSTHFLHVGTNYSLEKYTELYINEIFWEKLHEALGTRLNSNTTFDPQMNGQSKRVFQVLEDMLRSCVRI
ncbi:Gag protease polyprotein [Gossypium australe]|uniref:Gag protease polyprotein n=1 Tax=Gossypium australe TaxID=47621 RepID=A0A5B6WWB8_9ROSI|nr:Gag protease polyprotein [Gossypium australe]